MKATIPILTTLLLATAPAACHAGAEAETSRNLFSEYLGESESALDSKIDAAWKQLFYGSDDEQRVYYPVGEDMAYILAYDSGDVRSEGMSYGMMLAVQLDHKEEFDRLWKWAKTYMYHSEGSRKGYFAWQCKPDGEVIDPGSASDGEEWFATALFFASGRWGDGGGIFNYSGQANDILRAMLHTGDEGRGPEKTVNMFDGEYRLVRFVPLADWAKITDASYQLPAFYELWALWADADNGYWQEAARASRAYFHKAAHPKTGLMPDFSMMEDGSPHAWNNHENFSFDAHRTLANVAVDWAWFGRDEWQVMQSNRALEFLGKWRPEIPYTFSTDGRAMTRYSSTSITAMAAVAGLAADRDHAEPFVHDLWEAEIPSGTYRYYNGMTYFLGLLQAGGRFHVYAPEGKPAPFKK